MIISMVILLLWVARSGVTFPILAIVSITGMTSVTRMAMILSMSVAADMFSLCIGARSSRRFPVIRVSKIVMLARGPQNVIPINLAKAAEVDYLVWVLK